jgi:hypothetical protein
MMEHSSFGRELGFSVSEETDEHFDIAPFPSLFPGCNLVHPDERMRFVDRGTFTGSPYLM